ncbi:MAG: aldo/keto reductase [Alphaproteobacteria bacterium]|nr:aldo/keto reductase [Alphaproteobacteria bacterium]
MQTRALGTQGLQCSAIALGCMGMSGTYGPSDDAEAIRTIHAALESGVTMLDTAEVYGPFTNEELVGRALKGRREKVIVATKFGRAISDDGKVAGVDSNPVRIRRVVDASLRRLGIDAIDLLYQHRIDPAVPIEDVAGTVGELVRAGKVRWFGLSEASAATIARAHVVHPVSAVQTEYSLWERDVETEILPTLRRLGIGFVAYSPLGRGFLTGRAAPADQTENGNYRRLDPRFAAENFARNAPILDAVKAVAAELGATPAQTALAWLLAQGDDIVAIPGCKRVDHLRENLGAAATALTPAQRARLSAAAPPGATAGARYPVEALKAIDRAAAPSGATGRAG